MATSIQKRIISSKVSKSPDQPWIKPDPRTNSVSPEVIQKFKDRFSDLINFENIIPSPPSPPKHKQMPISTIWVDLGKAVNTCPYELEKIMTSGFDPNNQLAMNHFKKFLAAVKISENFDFSELNASKKFVRDYNNRLDREFKEKSDDYEYERTYKVAKQKDLLDNTTKAWSEICINITSQIQKNPLLDSLGSWDRALVLSLADHNSKACKIDNGNVQINFALIKKIKHASALMILDMVDTKLSDYKRECYKDFITNGPIEDIESYANKLSVTNPSSPMLLNLYVIIAKRKNMILVSRYNGKIEYIEPSRIDLDIRNNDRIWGGSGFFDASDKTILNIWKAGLK